MRSILSELHPGDVITADVLVSQDQDADVLLDHIVVVAQSKPDYKPAVFYHVPAPGDPAPDFKLRNQDGHAIHLGQFQGKALLVTFIYTRCPSPDFCPRVTRNFAAGGQETRGLNPRSTQRRTSLCVSFDPEHDTPARLQGLCGSRIWAAARPSHLPTGILPCRRSRCSWEMAQFFDLGMSTGEDTMITHTLSTTLIGPDGKVVRFYPGNEWTADQLTADVRQRMGS